MNPLMARPAQLTLGLILLLSSCLAVAPALAKDTTPPAPTTDSQILDFMADWQGADGQWTDPMTFVRIDPAKMKAEAAKRHGKPTPAAASIGAPVAGTGMSHAVR